MGQAFAKAEDYTKAVECFDFAIRCFRTLPAERAEHCSAVLTRLSRVRGEVWHQAESKTLGPAYLLYRDAERQRLHRNPLEAAKLYRQLLAEHPESVYAEAARLYLCLCALELQQVGPAELHLKEIVKAKPSSLYRGEALLTLARIAIEYRLDAPRASRYLDDLAEWLAEIEAAEAPDGEVAELPGVSEAARKLVTAANPAVVRDFWGNLHQQQPNAGTLINHKTCDWYLERLAYEHAKYAGFLAFADGDGDKALKHFERLPALSAMIRAAEDADEWNDYRRLRWGAEHEYLIAYPQELEHYRGRLRFAVLVGDFLYVTQEFAAAQRHFERLLTGMLGPLSSKQRDYPHYAIGECILRGNWRPGGNSRELAIEAWEQVLARRDGTWTEYRAAYAIGHMSQYTAAPQLRARGTIVLSALADARVDNEFTLKARLTHGIAMLNEGRPDLAARMFRRIPESAGDHFLLAQHLLNKVSQ